MPQFFCQQCGMWVYNDMIPMHNIKHGLGRSTGGLQRLANSATPAQKAEGLKYVGYSLFFGYGTLFWLSLLEKKSRYPVYTEKNKPIVIGILISLTIYLIRKRSKGLVAYLFWQFLLVDIGLIFIRVQEKKHYLAIENPVLKAILLTIPLGSIFIFSQIQNVSKLKKDKTRQILISSGFLLLLLTFLYFSPVVSAIQHFQHK
jgi:hypothetical protein